MLLCNVLLVYLQSLRPVYTLFFSFLQFIYFRLFYLMFCVQLAYPLKMIINDKSVLTTMLLFFLAHSCFYPCEIKRIHHWCSVGTEKSQPEGPPFQWETRLAEFLTEQWTLGLGYFWNHLTPILDTSSTFRDLTVQFYIISVGDVTQS